MPLEKTVVVAYTDIEAGGSRALLALDEENAEYKTLTIDYFSNAAKASSPDESCPASAVGRFQPFQLINCSHRQVSCIVLNAVIPGRQCHLVADFIMELISESSVERVIILSVLHFDSSLYGSQNIYEYPLSASKLTTYSSLPDTMPFVDSFLAVMIQMMKVEGVATNLLIIPGYRARDGLAGHSTVTSISQFHGTLGRLFGLKFNIDISKHLMYKGNNDADDDLASFIYL